MTTKPMTKDTDHQAVAKSISDAFNGDWHDTEQKIAEALHQAEILGAERVARAVKNARENSCWGRYIYLDKLLEAAQSELEAIKKQEQLQRIMTTQKTFIDEVHEEFRKKVTELRVSDEVSEEPVDFGYRCLITDSSKTINIVTSVDWTHVESFIDAKLSEAVREMVKAVPEKYCEQNGWLIGYNHARRDLIAKAREMGVEVED